MSRIVSRPGARRGVTARVRARLLLHCATVLGAIALLAALSAPASAANRVSIKLNGEIAPECFLDGGAGNTSALVMPISAGDLTKAGRRDLRFSVTCNSPFTYRMEAQHGALTLAGAGAPVTGFAAKVPYEVAVHIPTDAAPIDDRCPGEALREGQVRCRFSDSGNGIALGVEGRLTLAWTPGPAPPLAGAYADRLTVTIGARP